VDDSLFSGALFMQDASLNYDMLSKTNVLAEVAKKNTNTTNLCSIGPPQLLPIGKGRLLEERRRAKVDDEF